MSGCRSTQGISFEYNASDAEILFMSIDNIQLKVHSYMLRANSAVFRDLLGDTSSKPAFQPIRIDAASTDFTCFLDFMYQSHPTLPSSWTQAEVVSELCDRYKCDIIKERMMLALRSFSPKRPWEAFCFASHHDDIILARHALQSLGLDMKRKNATSTEITLEDASKATLPYLLGYFDLCNMLEPPLIYRSGLLEKDWNTLGRWFTPRK
ncbi:hypothetical protein V866_007797 [Kwoniella sp. B9012]